MFLASFRGLVELSKATLATNDGRIAETHVSAKLLLWMIPPDLEKTAKNFLKDPMMREADAQTTTLYREYVQPAIGELIGTALFVLFGL
ncbi:hypothetical protein KIN20_005212 [Parelaphostrongylus tenuis]|uniref:Uncharacterized protein n=1 Tax=Parelaphostrongylus tenuis TaxID=148309 RepID=A0AAD5QEZ9_PARTN|nr:hypothetical protein KIN20_005212 [Parelaphostrongylus tenuis]